MEIVSTENTLNEAKFDIHELFFSITDQKSTILHGNEVFFRISGYTKAELRGKYHNIIRHPDMPKIIFKTLWDYIQSDRPIIAYVKNMAKDGSFYWVIAAVFPLEDRYISIRFKPTSPIFDVIKELYTQLSIAEVNGGMEESARVLHEQLVSLGYADYDHFMSEAFLLELQSRSKLMGTQSISSLRSADNSSFPMMHWMHSHSMALLREFDVWFDKIDFFLRIKSSFETKGLVLRQLARNIVLLSLNASVQAYKVENGGEAFGVLASDIRVNAKGNDALIHDVDITVQNLSKLLHEVIFTVSCMHLQLSMINFFLEERGFDIAEAERDEIVENSIILLALVKKSRQTLIHAQENLAVTIHQCCNYLNHLEQQMMYLGYVQIYGTIESAAALHTNMNFGVIFSQLKELTHQTADEVQSMQKMGEDFNNQNFLLLQKSDRSSRLIDEYNEGMMTFRDKGIRDENAIAR